MTQVSAAGAASNTHDFADTAYYRAAIEYPYPTEILMRFADQFRKLNLFDRLAAVRTHIPGRIVFTTSFGLEDQAITHAIFSQQLTIDVLTFDTGRLYLETHQVWAETEKRYQMRVQALVPETQALEALITRQGTNGFRESVAARHACCNVRKVVPLDRALENASGWITGLRADQSKARSHLSFGSFDADRNLVKINPIFDWSRDDVAQFVQVHGVPINSLHDNGFLSIGCAPCTRAVRPGEPERAGRWWWEEEEKKECGLHLPAGDVRQLANTAK
jgi:phosphoadenosine phosphosulfate reductase